MRRRASAVLPVMALVVLTGCGGEGNQPVATGKLLQIADVVQQFRAETGDRLPGPPRAPVDPVVLCFCWDDGGVKAQKYGRFWLNIFGPASDERVREMLDEGEPDDAGVRWSLEREGWVAVKQYAANVVVVWQGGRQKADGRWKRLDRVLRRVTASP